MIFQRRTAGRWRKKSRPSSGKSWTTCPHPLALHSCRNPNFERLWPFTLSCWPLPLATTGSLSSYTTGSSMKSTAPPRPPTMTRWDLRMLLSWIFPIRQEGKCLHWPLCLGLGWLCLFVLSSSGGRLECWTRRSACSRHARRWRWSNSRTERRKLPRK